MLHTQKSQVSSDLYASLPPIHNDPSQSTTASTTVDNINKVNIDSDSNSSTSSDSSSPSIVDLQQSASGVDLQSSVDLQASEAALSTAVVVNSEIEDIFA